MGTVSRSITYRCSDDCVMSGCPGHIGTLQYHTVSDGYTFTMNGREISFERGELEAMIELIRRLDRADAIEI
jgi:hypothetical protein